MITGVEVLHGPFSVDTYHWASYDIGATWIAFLCVGALSAFLVLSCANNVPCNRRMFGAVVLMFVTYGFMLQRKTPRAEYAAFLTLFAVSYSVLDLAATEVYMDKIGTADSRGLTAIKKMEVMTWLNDVASFSRVLGAIVAGYIWQFYTQHDIDRRPYAGYAPPFGISIVLMGMCVIFYKRFQLKSQEATLHAEKEAMLQPQQITCMEE